MFGPIYIKCPDNKKTQDKLVVPRGRRRVDREWVPVAVGLLGAEKVS